MTNALIAFARAVGWGTVAGAAPFITLLFVPAMTSSFARGQIAELLIVLVLPLLVSGLIVLCSTLLIGLSLTFFLSERKREQGRTYSIAGLMFGALVPILLSSGESGAMSGGLWLLVISGALAGLVTGTSWGRWREALNRSSGPAPLP